ncbi:hypothetical protein [Dyella mobilis]|uniref:Uncharacterized protein n=1 Tax=Dyella mobilis TaxID=1849582 RepID=A0ABS2KEH6_9GAMM|nr:hypothetical protein [Dyella mobilis]MBM7129573.1 hypothetical protein [Dyella mobilis]
MSTDATPIEDSADEQLKVGISFMLLMLIGGPAFLLISLSTSTGVGLKPFVTEYLLPPAACLLAAAITWLWWKKLKSNGFRYHDRSGATLQATPGSAAARGVLLLAVLVPISWFCARAILRFVVILAPGHPVTTQATVLGVSSYKNCPMVITYRDEITSEDVTTCQPRAYGRPFTGESIIVQDHVNLLGANMVSISW